MKFLAISLLIYFFLKSIYYSMYEIKQNKNKPAGICITILAFLGLALPIFLLIKYY